MMAIFINGCATKAIHNDINAPTKTPGKFFTEESPVNTDLIRTALSRLNNTSGVQDYSAAKTDLELFVKKYPENKWTGCAQNLIQTIDGILILNNNVKLEKQSKEKIHAEKIKLYKENEALRAEAAKYHLENEQLRSDIALLKQLEIQLDKRGKMLK
jgi:hypothetical protein